MSGDLTALVAGTVLAVGALAFVLYPLFFRAGDRRDAASLPPGIDDRARDDSAVLALREIEFDRATGKLSENDYAELKRRYSERALQELRAQQSSAAIGPQAPSGLSTDSVPSDPVEARVRQYRLTHRECRTCGVRPEPDAVYCSTCGSYLPGACPRCGAEVTEPAAGFCSRCGAELARQLPSAAGAESARGAL